MDGDRDRGLWELGRMLGLWEPVVLEIEDSWAGGGLEVGIDPWECLLSACQGGTVVNAHFTDEEARSQRVSGQPRMYS